MSNKEPQMNKVQLRAACREYGIKGYSKMTVEQMREALRGHGDEDAAREFDQQEESAAAKVEAVATPAKGKRAGNVTDASAKGRPKAGGKCAAVWDWLDKHRDATLADVRAVAEQKDWNVSNASQELYAWRRFNGITSRAK